MDIEMLLRAQLDGSSRHVEPIFGFGFFGGLCQLIWLQSVGIAPASLGCAE